MCTAIKFKNLDSPLIPILSKNDDITINPKNSNLETSLTHRKEQLLIWFFVILYQDIFYWRRHLKSYTEGQ